MSPRVLAVVLEGQETAALDGLATLVAAARAEQGRIRLACLRPLPPPRVDGHDRLVADRDREMERIACETIHRFDSAVRVLDDVPIEPVVRFGPPGRELRIETEVFAPSLIAFFASPGPAPLRRLGALLLRRQAARQPGIRVLVVEAARAPRAILLRTPVPAPSS